MDGATVPREPIGWPLLPRPDGDGRLAYPSLDESVRETIRAILSTRPGEQLMLPEFGAGLDRFLHEPNSLTTRRRLRDAVQEALARWEGRIDLDRVEVSEVPDQIDELRVEVSYRLRRTGAARQVGLTLRLEA